MSFRPLIPLPKPDVQKQQEVKSLQQLALLAVNNPGEAARENLPPCHSVRIQLEAREFEEARHESKKEHEKKFPISFRLPLSTNQKAARTMVTQVPPNAAQESRRFFAGVTCHGCSQLSIIKATRSPKRSIARGRPPYEKEGNALRLAM